MTEALRVAREWEEDRVRTGAAISAVRAVHRVAREYTDPAAVAVGYAVATAHMADHAPGVLLYGYRALSLMSDINSVTVRAEQLEVLARLPDALSVSVREAFEKKESFFGEFRSCL